MDGPRMVDVAAQLRVQDVGRSAAADRRGRAHPVASMFINASFSILYSLLGIRLATSAFFSDSGDAFVSFMGMVTAPFLMPFGWLVPDPASEDGAARVVVILVALVSCMILQGIINRLLGMRAYGKPGIQRFNVGRHV